MPLDLPTKRNIETLEERRAYLLAEIARADASGASGNAGSFWKRELKALERVIGLANRVIGMSKEQQAALGR